MIYGKDKFPKLEILESNWEEIKKEFVQYHKEDYLYWADPNNPLYIPEYSEMEDKPVIGDWNFVLLKNKGEWVSEVVDKFPITKTLLSTFDTQDKVFFSVVDPDTKLIPHTGKGGGGIYRGQLGIFGDSKAVLYQVDKHEWPSQKALQDGETLVFENDKIHWLEHNGSVQKVSLVFDFKSNI